MTEKKTKEEILQDIGVDEFFEWQGKINVESEHDINCECDNCITEFKKWKKEFEND